MIDVTCPNCEAELEVPDSKAGTWINCPECETRVAVPAPAEKQTPRPAAKKPDARIASKPTPKTSPGRPAPAAKGKRPGRRRDDKQEASGSKGKLILGIAGGVLLLGLVVGGVLFFVLRGRDNKTGDYAQAPSAPSGVTPPRGPGGPPGFGGGPRPGPGMMGGPGPGGGMPGGPPPGGLLGGLLGGQAGSNPAAAGDANPPVDNAAPAEPGLPGDSVAAGPSGASGQDLYTHVLKSTVWILVPPSGGHGSMGTGSLVDRKNRLIVTNYHVVTEAHEVAVLFPLYEKNRLVQNLETYINIAKNQKDAAIKGRVVARDNRRDLALVQLDRVPAAALPLAVSDREVSPGQAIHSVGNPGAGGLLWVYAPGRVRAVAQKKRWRAGDTDGEGILNLEANVIMTDSPTNPGDSGGPLVNDRGEMVGVTHGIDPISRGVSLFIDRSEVVSLVTSYCKSNGLTWERSQRHLETAVAGGPAETSIPKLVKDLGSPDAQVRSRAVQALGEMGARAKLAVPEIGQLLKDPENLPRRLALDALARIGPDARPAAPALVAALKDPDSTFREAAAQTLGKIGPAVKDQAFGALCQALKDADRGVRVAAAEALAALGPLEAGDVPQVLELLKSGDSEARASAARALGQAPPARAREVVPALVAAYQASNDKKLRLAVVTDLGRFPGEAKAGLPVLSDALKSGSPELTQAACQTAARIGPEAQKLGSELAAALALPDSAVRKEVLAALRKVGPVKQTVPALARVLQEKDSEVRQEVLAVLETLGKDARPAVEALLQLFAEEKDLQKKITAVLAKIGKDAVPDLVKAMNDQNPAIRLGAVQALGEMGPAAKTAYRYLLGLSQIDPVPEIREEAARATQRVLTK